MKMENYPSPAAFKLPFSPKGWEEGGSLETLRRSEIQIKKHTKTSSQGYRMYPPLPPYHSSTTYFHGFYQKYPHQILT